MVKRGEAKEKPRARLGFPGHGQTIPPKNIVGHFGINGLSVDESTILGI